MQVLQLHDPASLSPSPGEKFISPLLIKGLVGSQKQSGELERREKFFTPTWNRTAFLALNLVTERIRLTQLF